MWNSCAEETTVFCRVQGTAGRVRLPNFPRRPSPAGSCQRPWRRERVRNAEEGQAFLDAVTDALAAAGYADSAVLDVRLALEQALDRVAASGGRHDVPQEIHVWCYVSADCAMARVEAPDRILALSPPACPLLPDDCRPSYTSAIRYSEPGDCMTLLLRRVAG